MSSTSTDLRFVRRLGTLWRDTGLHVLALPGEARAEVMVLGGGSALLWRLLDEPLGLDDILQRLEVGAGATAPDVDVVSDCLADLVARGLVDHVDEEPRP